MPELGAPADPSNQYSAARPEWYFLFLFQFLKLFEGWGERGELLGAVVIPAGDIPRSSSGGAASTPAAWPVPESATLWGLPKAFDITVSSPLVGPSADGVTVTFTSHEPPPGIVWPVQFCADSFQSAQ